MNLNESLAENKAVQLLLAGPAPEGKMRYCDIRLDVVMRYQVLHVVVVLLVSFSPPAELLLAGGPR